MARNPATETPLIPHKPYDHLQSLISWQIQFHYLARPGKTLEVLGLEVFHKIKVKEMPMFLKSWVPFCAFFWVWRLESNFLGMAGETKMVPDVRPMKKKCGKLIPTLEGKTGD